MSTRFAYRPRNSRSYQMRQQAPLPPHSRKDFLRYRWFYRQQHSAYHKRALGEGLLLLRLPRFVHGFFIRP